MLETTMIIRGQQYRITRDDILRAAHSAAPEPINVYYVEIDGRRYPPKQLIRLATGTRKSFDSMNARAALTRLDFVVKALL